MAASGLVKDYTEIARAVASYAGYPYSDVATVDTGVTAWDALQLRNVQTAVRGGYLRFWKSWPWKITRPQATLAAWADVTGTCTTRVFGSPNTTVSGISFTCYDPEMVGKSLTFTASGNSYTIVSVTSASVLVVSGNASGEGTAISMDSNGQYRLPDNVVGVDGPLYYPRGTAHVPVPVREQGEVMERRAYDVTGWPDIAIVTPRLSAGTDNPGWAVFTYPEPSQTFLFTYTAKYLPEPLSDARPYPVGGSMHSDTIEASCIAKFEELFHGGRGPKYAEYLEALETSKRDDATAFASDAIGNGWELKRCYAAPWVPAEVTFL